MPTVPTVPAAAAAPAAPNMPAMVAPDVTIVVNTSDSFEDCWGPFFTLFTRHWPDCPWPVVLNTERKDFRWPGLDLRASRVAAGATRRLTWSECLMACLDAIDTPCVLYLQEDYFLEGRVDTAQLQRLADALRQDRADVVRVMECGGAGPWHPTDDPLLWRVDARSPYRISTQAALWRRTVLRRHLRAHESPWQLEVFGSARARRRRDERVLCVNRDRFHGPGREIIPYTPTGVVKGRWERAVVEPLFAREGIAVDFSQRGFYDPSAPRAPAAPLWKRASDRLRSLW